MLTAPIVYPFGIIVAIVVGWLAAARGRAAAQVAARVVLVLYLTWIIGETLFPIPIGGHLSPSELDPLQRVLDLYNAPNLVPTRSILDTAALGWTWPAIRLLAGNVIVFMPFGILLPILWPRLGRLWRMALAGLCFSGAIELSQLAVSLLVGYWYRMPDVDDLLLNVAGVLLGYGLLVVCRSRRARRRQRVGGSGADDGEARAG